VKFLQENCLIRSSYDFINQHADDSTLGLINFRFKQQIHSKNDALSQLKKSVKLCAINGNAPAPPFLLFAVFSN